MITCREIKEREVEITKRARKFRIRDADNTEEDLEILEHLVNCTNGYCHGLKLDVGMIMATVVANSMSSGATSH